VQQKTTGLDFNKLIKNLQFKHLSSLFTFLLSTLLLAGYFLFARTVDRSDSVILLSGYAFIFAFSFVLIIQQKVSFWWLAIIGILAHCCFFTTTPALSQDFYRFIWDGRLFKAGFNPFLKTPLDFISSFGTERIYQSNFLIQKMGSLSAHHFSNYPPVSQFVYALSSFLGGKSISATIFSLRCITILSHIGTLIVGRKLLINLGFNPKRIFWFFLNPLIIIELTGNLHLEGVMIFFLILGFYLLHQRKWMGAAVFIALSISTKLLPLMFLPLFFYYFKNTYQKNWLKLIGFYALIGLVNLALFIPFLSQKSIVHFADSVGLWFQIFEFNASIYYLARFLGIQIMDYNPIALVGPALAILALIGILLLSFWKKQGEKLPFAAMLLAFFIYLSLTTTVHPWYLATPLLLSLFTRFKFMLLWSLTIFLSYVAYSNAEVNEQTWILALEYIPVYGLLIYEVWSKPKLIIK
jgi:hypothetical protein